jgi:hypothetical protein
MSYTFHLKAAIVAGACLACVSAIAGQSMATPQTGTAAAGFGRIMNPPPVYDLADNSGFKSLFDGTLSGWDYDHSLWNIQDGAIHIAATCEKPTGTVYAITNTGEYGDFILKYEMKGTGNINGGMQFRSYIAADPAATGTKFPPRQPPPPPPPGAPARAPRPAACANPGTPPTRESQAKWDMAGPQADFDAANRYSGMNYEQSGRAVISLPGNSMFADANGSWAVAPLADKATRESWFKKDDFNQFLVVCIGHSTSIYMNGHLMTQFVDTDPKYFRASGKIGIESESTGDLWVRNIWVKKL